MSRYMIPFSKEACTKEEHADISMCDDSCEPIELFFEIRGTVGSYDRGRRSGPPKDCYPAEGGEVEIEEVLLAGKKCTVDPDQIFTPKELERIDELLFEAMMEDDGYDYEPDDL